MPTPSKKTYRFRLLRGTYEDDTGRYEPRQVITSTENLAEKYGKDKFQPLDVSGETPTRAQPPDLDSNPGDEETVGAPNATPVEDDDEGEGEQDRASFEAMTVAELREHAENEEIDLTGAKTKEQIIDKIMEALEG